MNKLLFFALTVSINLAFAESAPYKWTRSVSKIRTLRGVNQDILVSEIKNNSPHVKAECEKDEIYVSGGCSAIYGLTLQTNSQYSFEATPENVYHICGFKLDRSSLLSATTGNKPTPNTPDTDLQAHGAAHVICDKITN